jgi:prepilin-type N-terminal cleavage/methylation domain-containing protein
MSFKLSNSASNSHNRGFTLLEILLVIAIIAILAAIVIVAINPVRQLAQARNAQRASDLNAIYKALQQYYVDNLEWPWQSNDYDTDSYEIPDGTAAYDICDTGGDSSECVNLGSLVPNYISALPTNPSDIDYVMAFDTGSKISLGAPGSAEQELAPIVIGKNDRVEIAANTGGGGGDESGWYLVFKSSDPAIWNTNVGSYGEEEYSLSADDIPSDMSKLKLVWDNNEKTIDLTHEKLLNCTAANGNYYWNGTLDDNFGGVHLGITDSSITQFAEPDVLPGNPCINDRGGWGFGHIAYQNSQGFGWNGINTNINPLPIVEIYVYTNTPIPE